MSYKSREWKTEWNSPCQMGTLLNQMDVPMKCANTGESHEMGSPMRFGYVPLSRLLYYVISAFGVTLWDCSSMSDWTAQKPAMNELHRMMEEMKTIQDGIATDGSNRDSSRMACIPFTWWGRIQQKQRWAYQSHAHSIQLINARSNSRYCKTHWKTITILQYQMGNACSSSNYDGENSTSMLFEGREIPPPRSPSPLSSLFFYIEFIVRRKR